jgi:hypothetical protein
MQDDAKGRKEERRGTRAETDAEREREREEARRERTKERAGATVIMSAGENYPAVIYHPPSGGPGPNA